MSFLSQKEHPVSLCSPALYGFREGQSGNNPEANFKTAIPKGDPE
jgi:hypothetical protein